MFLTYIKIAIRHFGKRKVISVISACGLGISMAAALLVLQYAAFEFNYDRFQPLHQRMYRINTVDSTKATRTAFTFPALGPTINDLEIVEDYFRLVAWAGSYTCQLFQNEDRSFREQNAIFSDPSFVQHFGLEFIYGSADLALQEPNRVILSKNSYERYFGSSYGSPVGHNLVVYNSNNDRPLEFIIDGIFEPIPDQSHLTFDLIFSHSSLPNFLPEEVPEEVRLTMFETSWGPETWYTYVVLKPEADVNEATMLINNLIARNNDAQTEKHYELQEVSDIHTNSSYENEPSPTVDSRLIQWLFLAGAMLLCIAYINYINLSTARIAERVRESGLRKLAGAGKATLVSQFITESVVENGLALLVGFVAYLIVWPHYLLFIGKEVPLPFTEGSAVVSLICIGMVGGLFILSIYPGWLLASVSPSSPIKRVQNVVTRDLWFRRLLVSVQFASSIVLLAITLSIYRQLTFVHTQDIGFQAEGKLVVEGPHALEPQMSVVQAISEFKNHVASISGISAITASSHVPGDQEMSLSRLMRHGKGEDDAVVMIDQRIDSKYFEVMDISFIAGRGFRDGEAGNKSVVLNEEAVQRLGFTDPESAIGAILSMPGAWGISDYEVIGVVKNFHHRSLHNFFDPIVFFNEMYAADFIIEVAESQLPLETIDLLERSWGSIFPGNPFVYYFLDSFFNKQYDADIKIGKLFTAASVISVITSCLGLFALASYVVVKRRKEISIRKVFGATVVQLVTLLSRESILVLSVSAIIALPVAIAAVQEWLKLFAYKTSIHLINFIYPAALVFCIALITIGYQTIKTATSNPACTLRDE